MRSLLQNKFTTVILLVGAIAALYTQRAELLGRIGYTVEARTPTVAAEGEGDNQAAPEASFIVTTNSPARYLTELANWRSLFPDSEIRRDPFSSNGKQSGFAPGSEPTAEQGEIALELQAVSIQPQRTLAVINRQVVAQGDVFQGYTVETITNGEVTLSGDRGRRVLQMRFDLPSTRPSSPDDPSPPTAEADKPKTSPR